MKFLFNKVKIILLAVSVLAPHAAPVLNTASEETGQKFIEDLGAKAISILTNKNLDENSSKAEFSNLLKKGFDLDYIAMFSLGSNRRLATPQELSTYKGLFEKWLVQIYGARFREYKGVSLQVLSAKKNEKGIIAVDSIMTNPKDSTKVNVQWHLHQDAAKNLRIRDVLIEGVSMSLNHRSDFASILSRGGNKFSTLIKELQAKVN